MVSLFTPYPAAVDLSRFRREREETEGSSNRSANSRCQLQSREDRIRLILRWRPGQRLPQVDRDLLTVYRDYLAWRLLFPFRANRCDEIEPLVFDRSVVVCGLADPRWHAIDTIVGVVCQCIVRDKPVDLGLGLLKLDDASFNQQLVDDYWHWFWNYR
jgi:hypothetical protein